MRTMGMPWLEEDTVSEAKVDLFRPVWFHYEAFLAGLPEPVAHVARSVITRRRIKERFTAGLHFPLWFSEAFSEQRHEDLYRLTLGNLYLYLYVVIKDDQLDDHLHSSWETTIAADLHQTRSFRILQDLCGEREFFSNEFQRIRKAWLEHDRALIEQYKSGGHTVPDFEGYAKKCAILKASGLVLASHDPDPGTWAMLSRAYDLTAIANTFADDLTDWKEDVRSNHRTYLVSTALRENCLNPLQDLRSLPEEEMALLIYRSNAVGTSLEHSLRFTEEAKTLFASCGAYSWCGFVEDLESNIIDVIAGWQEVRDRPAEEILEFDTSLKTKFCGT